MDMNFSVFQEPRGVMRILHFIFSICAFATTTGFTGKVTISCPPAPYEYNYDYPFNLMLDHPFNYTLNKTHCTPTAKIIGDFSSDAKFFVATGVLAMIYSVFITVFYVKFDQLYKTNNQMPLIDFIMSVIVAVLWLSGSAAWANGLGGLKHVTADYSIIDWDNLPIECKCVDPTTSSFFTLNVSVIFGFLNFFLWASNLWFLYKETTWFSNAQPATEGV